MQDKTFKYSMDEFINEPSATVKPVVPNSGQFKYSMDEFVNEPVQQPPPRVEPVQQPTVAQQSPLQRVASSPLLNQTAESIGDVGGTVFDGIGNLYKSIKNSITGGDRETYETKNLQELGSFDEGNASDRAAVISATMWASSDKDRVNILTNNIEGINFRDDAKGNTIVILPPDEDGWRKEAVLNKPGLSLQDFTNTMGNVLMFLPAAKAIGFASSIAGKIGIGVAANAATDVAVQAGGIAAGRERDFDPVQTAISGVVGGVTAPIGMPGRQVRESTEALNVEQAAIKDAAGVVQNVTGEKVPIYQAQQSLLGADIAKQRISPELKGSQKFAADRLKEQDVRVYDASMGMIDSISTAGAGFTNVRGAADAALKTAKRDRRAATKQLYDDAFAEPSAQQIDITPLTSKIDDLLASNDISPSSPAAKSLVEFKKLVTGRDGEMPSLKLLQTAKIDIAKRMKTIADQDSSIGNNTANTLRPFVGKLKEVISNSSRKFDEAEQAFAQNSTKVNQIEDSLLPIMSKIPDHKIDSISTQIFGSGASIQAVKDAKELISASPDGKTAWDGLIQSYLLKRIRNVSDEGASPASISRAIFGSESHKKLLLDAMDDGVAKNFDALYTVLDRAKRGRPGGSDTTSKLAAVEDIRAGFWPFMLSALYPIKAVAGKVMRNRNERQELKAARLMFDPRYKDVASTVVNGMPGSGNVSNRWVLSTDVAGVVAQALNQIDLELDKEGYIRD